MSYLLRAAAEAIKNEAREIANDANNVAVPRELIGLLVGALRATPPVRSAPSPDRSANAVAPDAWQFLGSSPQSGITEPFPTERWRECLDPEAAKDAGYEVRPLWAHPPAQPASPGPLQPGASQRIAAFLNQRLADAALSKGHRVIWAVSPEDVADALSADHDAKEAMLTTDDVPIEKRGKLCTICGKIVPELEAEGHCAGHGNV